MTRDPQPTLLGALWRFRAMAAAIVAVAVVLATAVGLAVAPPATASGAIALTTPPPDAVVTPGTQSEASLARFTEQRARFATSDAVLTRVADSLGRSGIEALRNDVSARASGTSNTILIEATDDDEDGAIALVVAVIDAYRTETEAEFGRLTDAAIESIESTQAEVAASLGTDPDDATASSVAATVGQLQLEISDLRTTEAVYGDGVDFVNEPREGRAASPPPVREALLGLVVGLALAGTAAWLRADRDAGVDSALELEAALQVPSLGVVSERSDQQLLSPFRIQDSPSAAYRLVWTALRRQMPSGVVVLASTGVDARSVAAINIATAAARDNRSVLLVDADLRTSQVSFALSGGDRRPEGLRTVLGEGTAWSDATYRPDASGLPTLSLLPSGLTTASTPSVSTDQVESLVAAWREAFDLVVIDTESVLSDQLAAMIHGAADGVLLVVGKGTPHEPLADLGRRMSLQGSAVVGGVLASSAQ